jgi:transposase InsO family protein
MVISKVKRIREKMPETGGRKLQKLLAKTEYGDPIIIGRDKLFDILRFHGMLYRRPFVRIHTSVSDPRNMVYPNLLKDMTVTHVNQVWVTDITYLHLVNGKHCYLSIMTDYYSRKIIGWSLQDNMSAESTLETFEKAYKRVKPGIGLIHHSDKGSQYTSDKYATRLAKYGVKISMTGVNKCYDNALAERINGILKYEFGLRHTFNNMKQARRVVADAIYLYNNKRIHLSLNYETPNDFYNNALAS